MNFFTRKQKKTLESLGLYTEEIQDLLEKLIGKSAWTTYQDSNNNSIDIQILKLRKGRYFALLNCESLCGMEDKQLFIKDAVEFAIKNRNLSLSFKNIAVGGIAGDEGRLAFLSRLKGETPPPVHAYTVFKVPGEDEVCIEDPRTGVFDTNEKLQSRLDDQVCCFAASSLFYFCYKTLGEGETIKSTSELFAELYKSSELRTLIQALEKKVGHSTATKEQVIDSFVKQIISFENPIGRLEHADELREDRAHLKM